MTIKEALLEGKKILRENNIEDELLVSKVLLASILKIRKEELIIKSYDKLEKEKLKLFLKRHK